MNLSLENKLKIPDTTLYQELDGECVLLNLANESYYGLNESGTHMWNALTQMDSINQALNFLLDEYDVEEKQLRADLYEFIDELLENKILQISTA